MVSSATETETTEDRAVAEVKSAAFRSMKCAFSANYSIILYLMLVYTLLLKFELSGGYFKSLLVAFCFMPYFLASALTYYGLIRLQDESAATLEEQPPSDKDQNPEKDDYYTEKGRESLLRFKWLHLAVLNLPCLTLVFWFIDCRLRTIWQDSFIRVFQSYSLFNPEFFLVGFFLSSLLLLFRANYQIRYWINPVRPIFSRKRLWFISTLYLAWLFSLCFYIYRSSSLNPHPGIFFLFGIMYLIATVALHPTPARWSIFKKYRKQRLQMVRWLPVEIEQDLHCPGKFKIPSLGYFEGPSLFLPVLTTCGNVYPLKNGFLLETIEQGKSDYGYTFIECHEADFIMSKELSSGNRTFITSFSAWHQFTPDLWEPSFCDSNMDLFWEKLLPFLENPVINDKDNAEKWIKAQRDNFLLVYSKWVSLMVETIATKMKKNQVVSS